MEPTAMVDAFCAVADAVRVALDGLDDWVRLPDTPSQYRHDVVADEVAVPMLLDAGFGVLSEESGAHEPDREIVAVLDPVDGSTNASIGLPWFATSIAAVRRDLIGRPGDDGLDAVTAAMVRNQALGVTYTAVAGQGARRDGARIAPSPCRALADAIVVVNDLPPRLGARQFRVYGAAALDLCAVADGTFDGFVDCGVGLSPWDHLGAALICDEAGASVATLDGGPIVDLDGRARQAIVAGACAGVRDELAAVVLAARRRLMGVPRPSRHGLALRVFAALPRRARHRAVRLLSPTFTGGAVVAATRPDGRVLLVTHAYSKGWGLPGGLLDRGETPVVTVRREVLEEVGLGVDVAPHGVAVLTPNRRHFNFVFRAAVSDAAADLASPRTPEITEVGWFALDDLPNLLEFTDLLLGAVGILPPGVDEAHPERR